MVCRLLHVWLQRHVRLGALWRWTYLKRKVMLNIRFYRYNWLMNPQPSHRHFKKVSYSAERIQVDFFRSLLTLPEPTLMREWYMADGQVSICAESMRSLDSGGREEYWDKFNSIQTLKTPEWSTEHEYRLTLEGGFFHDISEIALRKATYDFSVLEGIVFGIKTPASAKAEIIRIIHAKCVNAQRKNFRFYQARFDYRKHEMVFDELKLFHG